MKLFTLFLSLFFSFLSFSSQSQSQTMTFDSGPAESGFVFSGWASLTTGAINQVNLAFSSTITRSNIGINGTWNITSIDVGPFVNGVEITITSNKGDSQIITPSGPGTINLTGFTDITTLSFTRTGFSGAASDYDNFVFTVNPNTLSTDDKELDLFNISPNPFNDEINIKTPRKYNGDEFNITIYDFNGRKVYDKVSVGNNNGINLSGLNNLEEAFYFIRVLNTNNGGFYNKRLIKY